MPKVIVVIISVIAILNASCSKKQEAAAKVAPVVKGASIETVKLSSLDDVYEAVGTLRSKTTSVLSSKVVGSIIAMHVREGDRVRAGQVLLEIDNREAKTEVQKAQAGLREAQSALEEVKRNIRAAESAKTVAEANQRLAASTFKRYQALLERRSVSSQEFDEVKAKYQVAEAEAERADRLLGSLQAKRNQVLAQIDQAKAEVANTEIYAGYAQITSPINGLVAVKSVEVGALAAPGTPLLTIEDAHYRLEVAVEESQTRNIRLKTPARVLIPALGENELAGTVTEMVPTADPASRSYTVKIELPAAGAAAQQSLRSGLFGKARFTVGQREAMTIPTTAIIQRGQLISVYVVDAADIAHLRLVKTGRIYGERTEILSGLNDGELIVVKGAESVSEGSRVECDCELTPIKK